MLTESRKTLLHPALVRPVLLGGAERELVLVEIFTIIMLLGIGLHPLTIGAAVLIGTVGHSLLVYAAKADPQLRHVYTRHVVYQDYYLANVHPDSPVGAYLPHSPQS